MTDDTTTETDAVLAANLEFYRAFGTCDYPAMNALWARLAPVLCIHPGWPAIRGREGVMRSWRNLLGSPEPTRVACHDDQAFLYDDFALVICEEELSAGNLVATNMFVKEDGRWRMVHHQASPLVGRPQGSRPPPLRRR
ncbi:MAG TPA: nuclear transport factor 2 family protein [Stellaceae bacterium]|nr:nuclear transport factor 2 family protein [Stellaceae bacterium]